MAQSQRPADKPAADKRRDEDLGVHNADTDSTTDNADSRPTEYGGRNGPDPVRYGDWEKNGRCIDF